MSTPAPVTVIGLGPMGQAMARTLLAAGHPVTVWNRTSSRADSLVEAGARRAATPVEAVAASGLVILSLTDYAAMYDILRPASDGLAGVTLTNLSSDTPQRTREAAVWATGHGARFLTGGVMTPAPMVGTADAFVYYSGSEEVFAAHRPVLEVIGAARYLGDDSGLAQLMYQAHLDVFLTALSALMHATALMGSAGVSATDFIPEVMTTLAGIPAMLDAGEPIGPQLDARTYPGQLSTTAMMGATADHIVTTSKAAGIDLALPEAVKDTTTGRSPTATARTTGRASSRAFDGPKAHRRPLYQMVRRDDAPWPTCALRVSSVGTDGYRRKRLSSWPVPDRPSAEVAPFPVAGRRHPPPAKVVSKLIDG